MATERPRPHGKEVLHDIDEDYPDFPSSSSSSSSSSTNGQQHPSRAATAVPPRYWLEGVVAVWMVVVVALGVWVLVAWTVAGQGGAGACKAALHTAGRATFDLVCTTSPPRQHHPAGRWAGPAAPLLAAASSYLPRFAREWVRDHAAAGHEQWCPLTRAVVAQEPSPGTVWAVVLGLAALSLLHFRMLRHSVFRTPSRCMLVLCSCVAASVLFLRFLVSADPALRSSACRAAQATTPLEFSCTDDSLSETMSHLRAVLPLPTWRDVVAVAPKRGLMAWMVRAVGVLEPGAKYVGLCLGAALLLLPEALQRAIHTLLRRALRHPAGKAALALAVSSVALVLWIAHARGGNDENELTAELLGYWALSSLVGFLFVQAVWPHLFRVAFFALAPAYVVGGAILFYKALAVFLRESCGAALPVSLGLTLVLFYAHRWDCTKAFGAYVLWKSLGCFTIPFYSLPTFFSFVYWWTSSLTTTIFSALTHLASATTSSSSATSSSSSATSTHLSMPWSTLDALFLLYFAGVALAALLNSLAYLALLAAQRHLVADYTTQHHRHHDAPPPVDLDQHYHPKRD